MNRPDIRTALDIRSYERIVVATVSGTARETYPDDWERISGPEEIEEVVDEETVVVVDRVELARRTYVEFFRMRPRLLAVAVKSIEHEKSTRRTLSSIHPFAEVWTFSTDFGKVLVTDAKGEPYDRDRIIDVRPWNGAAA